VQQQRRRELAQPLVPFAFIVEMVKVGKWVHEIKMKWV
jgi:hypothetical protein